MATRYTSLATAVVIASTVGAGVYTAVDAPAARTAIGAQAEVLTTNGDLVVREGGATTRRAIGSEGHVLTVTSGLPQWAAPAGGGVAASAGAYASRPGTCAEGDTYRVSSGARTGSVYRCAPANTWTLVDLAAPTSVAPIAWWDTERLESYVGQQLVVWRGEGPSAPPLHQATNVSTQPTVLAAASAWGGLPAASWASGAGALITHTGVGPAWDRPRTFVAVVSSISSAATRTIGGWGRSAGSLRCFSITAATNTGLSFYGTDPVGSVASPATSTPAILVATYTGTNYALRQATLAASPSWSYSLSSAAASLNTYTGGFLVGAHPWDTNNLTDPYVGRIHWLGTYATALSEAESDALAQALYARLQ